jgi:uncharacterized protein (TIGR03437 family)
MRVIGSISSLLLFAGIAAAQQQPSLTGFTCVANAGVPPIVRVEGITELVGDLLLQCSGGKPTPLGAIVPTANITLFLNTNVTSRLLSNGASDALLLVDEPGGAPNSQIAEPSNANTPQSGCITPIPGCQVIGTGNGVGTYNGTGTGPHANPNIFQGKVSGNSIEWEGIPIDPPGTNEIRVVRLTNVRVNANQLGLSSTLIPTQIVGFVSITPVTPSGPPVFITNPTQILGNSQPGVLLGDTPATEEQCPGFYGSQIFHDTGGSPVPATTIFRYQEGFPGSWKTKQAKSVQNVPGAVYNSESNFIPNPAAGLPSLTGQADTGTIFQGYIILPSGLNLSLPQTTPLVDSNNVMQGFVTTASPGATLSGGNLVVKPAAGGGATVFFQVTQRNDPSVTGPLSLPITATFTGTANTVPSQFLFTGGFANQQFTPTTLFIPGSSNASLFPNFGSLSSGASTPAEEPYLLFGSDVPCVNSGMTLDPFNIGSQPGPATLQFFGFNGSIPPPPSNQPADLAVPDATATLPPSLQLPRLNNVGLTSSLLATPNISVTKDSSATWLNVGLSSTTTPATAIVSVNPAAVGNYSTTLKFSSPSAGTVSVPVTYSVTQGPWFTRYGFQHQASYVSNIVAPGEPFVIIGGDDFGPANIAVFTLGADGKFPTTVGNTQVLFDGVPAPLYYSLNNNGKGQVTGFAPFSLANKINTTGTTDVQVVYNGVKSPPVTLFIVDAVPGLYTADSSGSGPGAILNQNLSVNTASNPEAVGNYIVLYGGGAGQTTPGGRDGATGTAAETPNLPVKVFIDGIQATDIPFAKQAPGLVEGVFQINVRIPPGVRPNTNVPVVVQFGDKQTQPGVTVATK